MKVQSGLRRPEQRWRGPVRGKIALWSVIPGAAIVIVVGGLFWASIWIALRTPTVTVNSASTETARAAVSSADGHSDAVAAAPSEIDGVIVARDQDDPDDRDFAGDSDASDDRDMAGDWAVTNTPTMTDDGDASVGRAFGDEPAVVGNRDVSGDRDVAEARSAADDESFADDQSVADDEDAVDGQVVADRSDDGDEDQIAMDGPLYGPDFGPDQIAAVLAWANSPDGDAAADQVADAGTSAIDRAEEIAARAGELTVRAEELTARIDGLTAKIDELQAKLEAGTALMVQASPVPAPRIETVAARAGLGAGPGAQSAAATATPTAVPAGKAPWVVLPQPEPGSRVAAGAVVLETRARGAAPITQIRLQIDGVALQVALDRRDDTTWRGRATTRVSPGSHTVAVAVVDGQGRVGSYQWKFDATPS